MTFEVKLLALISALLLHIIKNTMSTIDLNAAQLQYLADHLTFKECRRLVAAAHFKSYEQPNALDQAERKVPKDLSCSALLHHWNSEPGEGKGETHQALEHRLRQMGKYELADWLGRSVFHQLTKDLNRSLENGLKDLATEESTNETYIAGPTLSPIIENADPTEWSALDTILYAVIVGLLLTIIGFCTRIGYSVFCNWKRNRRKRKVQLKKQATYDLLETETSGSESEDKFDVRNYAGKNRVAK